MKSLQARQEICISTQALLYSATEYSIECNIFRLSCSVQTLPLSNTTYKYAQFLQDSNNFLANMTCIEIMRLTGKKSAYRTSNFPCLFAAFHLFRIASGWVYFFLRPFFLSFFCGTVCTRIPSPCAMIYIPPTQLLLTSWACYFAFLAYARTHKKNVLHRCGKGEKKRLGNLLASVVFFTLFNGEGTRFFSLFLLSQPL